MNNETTTTTNEAKTFKASIYQLDKESNLSFETITKGSINVFDSAKVAEHISNRVFKVLEAQKNIKAKGISNRFFNLSTGKALYFNFEIDGKMIIDSELYESVKVKLNKMDSAEALQTVLFEVMEVFADIEYNL